MKKKLCIISDISKTLVGMGNNKRNFYNESLFLASKLYFGGVELNMKMASDGRVFPDHIKEVLLFQKEKLERHLNYKLTEKKAGELAGFIIDQVLRPYLVEQFSTIKPQSVPGLKMFLGLWEKYEVEAAIVTGDLRAVAKQLMINNTAGDLRKFFPEKRWVCGDDEGFFTRLDQLRQCYKLLKPEQSDLLLMVDDAANGIKAMAELADEVKWKMYKKIVIVGVLTGNYNKGQLLEAGANFVVQNVGEIPALLEKYF